MQRYSSAKDELSHILTTIYFNSVEVVYYTSFLPLKFVKLDTELHFDTMMYIMLSFNCLFIMLLLLCSYYLRKRAIEMQFNAKMQGHWIGVTKPSNRPIVEWRPHTSYPQGTIVSLSRSHHMTSNQKP